MRFSIIFLWFCKHHFRVKCAWDQHIHTVMYACCDSAVIMSNEWRDLHVQRSYFACLVRHLYFFQFRFDLLECSSYLFQGGRIYFKVLRRLRRAAAESQSCTDTRNHSIRPHNFLGVSKDIVQGNLKDVSTEILGNHQIHSPLNFIFKGSFKEFRVWGSGMMLMMIIMMLL